MSFPLVQEEADAAEGRVETESAAELLQLGVFAVLVVLESLSVTGGVCAVFTIINGRLFLLSRVFGQHVIAKLIFPFAGISTDLTHEGFGLMS